MKSHPVPRVGDTVVLNNFGLEQVFGHSLGLSHMKTLRMKVTQVDSESVTFPVPTYPVKVDNAEINAYLIDHHCFDVVEVGVKVGQLSPLVASGQGGHSRFKNVNAPSVRYEQWSTSAGRSGIQRTLDSANAQDQAFLDEGIQILDENGNVRSPTFEEAEQIGVRRIVAARDIHSHRQNEMERLK